VRTTAVTLCVGMLLVSGVLRSAPGPAAQAQAVNPEVLQLQTSVDLVANDVGFNGLGEIILTLHNRGAMATNPPGRVRGSESGAPKIQIDLYMGGVLVESVYQQYLGGKESKVLTVKPVANIPTCGDARDLKVVVDPHNTIKELHDDNNTTALRAARPCPDLAVDSIERNYSGLLKETYTPEVTIVNRGNWPSPSTQVWGTALTNLPGINSWPELSPTHTIPGLAPGQKTSFKIGGSVLSTSHSWVRIMLDRFFKIDELDEGNNFLEKKI